MKEITFAEACFVSAGISSVEEAFLETPLEGLLEGGLPEAFWAFSEGLGALSHEELLCLFKEALAAGEVSL